MSSGTIFTNIRDQLKPKKLHQEEPTPRRYDQSDEFAVRI